MKTDLRLAVAIFFLFGFFFCVFLFLQNKPTVPKEILVQYCTFTLISSVHILVLCGTDEILKEETQIYSIKDTGRLKLISDSGIGTLRNSEEAQVLS